ncbi:MAG: tyrosine-type recombinase/integrase [Gammaproteobacteria bacterium]|nr:tyrosine-type recombinase/integrase [Gammaproteobacteria bacterium]
MRRDKTATSSKATCNRYMACVRAILKKSCEWGWLKQCPKVAMYALEAREPRWITPDEFDALYAVLPPHQAVLAHFGVTTGLRQRNVSLLKWNKGDMARTCAWVTGASAKGKRGIAVPLSRDALAILAGQRGQHPEYVFAYKGEPVWQVNTLAWRKAVRAAGIAPFRWHDLRHTWASWHCRPARRCMSCRN